MKSIILILLSLSALLSFAQNEKTNRDSFYLNIVVDSDNNYGMDIQTSP